MKSTPEKEKNKSYLDRIHDYGTQLISNLRLVEIVEGMMHTNTSLLKKLRKKWVGG
jgi:hypothetical protein